MFVCADHIDWTPLETVSSVLAAANWYDFLLAIVPVAFAVALIAAAVTSVPQIQMLAGAALVGVLVIIEACYRNPPLEQGYGRSIDSNRFLANSLLNSHPTRADSAGSRHASRRDGTASR
ncbi:hypothetical protein [Natronolimnobius baerhuensis]|uniref:Uncharacterized protein n=1 Tax=Natronolimnobius baerhuensis TaxID=253108 RepID=A0A202E9R4_9EURY|nr:hypothetical protein B2G88_11380 [Natronolimnobius baerhuensis]